MSNEMIIPGNPYGGAAEANEQALYATIMYLPLDRFTELEPGVSTIDDIIVAATEYNKTRNDSEVQDYLDTVIAIRDANGLDTGNIVIDDFSWTDKTQSYGDTNGLQAASFRPSGDAGNVAVAFRGTPNGAWVDNGYSLMDPDGPFAQGKADGYIEIDGKTWGPMSPMDKATMEYMAAVQANHQGASFTTTGHSKGGHEAQIAGMVFSSVTGVWSFDGYGVSDEFYAQMQRNYGDDFNAARGKIISINGNNDYVNVLGRSIALSANTVFLFTNSDGTFDAMGNHLFTRLIENGQLLGIDPDGQGYLANLVSDLYRAINALPVEEKNILIMAALAALQQFLAQTPPLGGWSSVVAGAITFLPVVVMNPFIIISSFAHLLGSAILSAAAAFFQTLFGRKGYTQTAYAAGHSRVKINTDTFRSNVIELQSICDGLNDIIDRMSILQQRANYVYMNFPTYAKVLSFQSALQKGVTYLNKTAEAFEGADNDLKNAVPSFG